MRTKLLIAGGLAMLGGCATPEQRIETKLVAAGLGERQSRCMAHELTDRLSYSQLRTLNEAAKEIQQQNRLKRLTVGELARQLDRMGDPKLIVEVTRAGLGCAILG